MPYNTPKPPSALQRQAAARDRDKARHDAWIDPEASAIRRIRAAIVAVADAGDIAARQFHEENDPVQAPRGVGGGLVHPSRLSALAALMKAGGWSDNPAEPIIAARSADEIRSALAIEAEAELAAANAAYQAVQAVFDDRRDEAVGCELTVSPAVETSTSPAAAVVPDTAPRGRGRPPKLAALIGDALLEPLPTTLDRERL